jgi:hypothetical protein
MRSTICDVAVLGDGPMALVAATAAAVAGADALLLGAEGVDEDILLAAILAEQARRTGVRRLAHCDVQRVVRRGRSLVAVVCEHAQIEARFFVDASERCEVVAKAGIPARALPVYEPSPDREYIDTIAVYDTASGRCALPYGATLIPALDNALTVPRGDAVPAGLAIAGAHAVGVAAALLAASGQPAAAFDSATLRERLRDDGARL